MIKRFFSIIPAVFMAFLISPASGNPDKGDEDTLKSRITAVKLYQNQAEVVRQARIQLKKGNNSIKFGGLSKLLYDWSVKGKLPANFSGKILSLEIQQKALVQKRQKRILDIEETLEKLREKDQVHVDTLKNLASQDKFLDSIFNFTDQAVSKELQTRIPQVAVWDNTLKYVTEKKRELLQQRRQTEKEREKLGREIQKWEFELSQIAGTSYYDTYRSLNDALLTNKANMAVQQYAEVREVYSKQRSLLRKPTENVEIEKRVVVDIWSAEDNGDVNFSFSYVIPNTYWQMQYDVRASREKKEINLLVYANIYQKTEEDWDEVGLNLSTGSPVNAISPPVINPWFLDVYVPYSGRPSRGKDIEGAAGLIMKAEAKKEYRKETAEAPREPEISEKGPYIEIAMPIKQSIQSSNKYQKKFIRDYTLKESDRVKFYYEILPGVANNSFLKVETVNATNLPWLSGESQIFLENEFMGKVNIPYTPQGKKERFVLGLETRLAGRKELVKKFEDTAGVFGGRRKITYSYKVIIENELPQKTEVFVLDNVPVSRNEKIEAAVKNLSLKFDEDEEFRKSTDYANGLRRWKLLLNSHQKIEITYDIDVSFDKDITINGLR